jgi:hypothetical protein
MVVPGTRLGFARRELHGGFFSRYGLKVLAICLGGATMGRLHLASLAISLEINAAAPDRVSDDLSSPPSSR